MAACRPRRGKCHHERLGNKSKKAIIGYTFSLASAEALSADVIARSEISRSAVLAMTGAMCSRITEGAEMSLFASISIYGEKI